MAKLKKIFMILSLAACLTCSTVTAYATGFSAKTHGGFNTEFNAFKEHYSIFISIFMSIMLISSIAIFVYHCFMLASSGSNALRRTQAIQNILTTGFCLSAQSAISLIVSLVFWGFMG